ncbi:MAG: hypothetical protein KC713_01895 [Candidatus Omnitrophica bacterium]|nr:hypothetical protein [Candidatus Omnitrophota bacterium]
MKVLQLVSKGDSLPSILNAIKDHAENDYLFCALHPQAETLIRRLNHELEQEGMPTSFQHVPFQKHFKENAIEAKERYIRWVSDFGRKPVKKHQALNHYYTDPKKMFSYWWLSLVYEKSPGKSDAFLAFMKFFTIVKIKDAYQCQTVNFTSTCDERLDLLLHQLKGKRDKNVNRWWRDIQHLGKEYLRVLKQICVLLIRSRQIKKASKGAGQKPLFAEDHQISCVTMFPYCDSGELRQGRFISHYYGSLQNSFDEMKMAYSWFGLYSDFKGYSWKTAVDDIKKIKQTQGRFTLLEEWITLRDVLSMIKEFERIKFRTLRVLGVVKSNAFLRLTDDVEVNLWPVIAEDFMSSFAGKVLITNLMYLRAFNNYVHQLPPKTTIVHYMERHCWEKALNIITARKEDIKTIGIQHTHMPLMLLNYFPLPEDIQSKNLIASDPTDDWLLTTGSVTRTYFEDCGFPKEKISVLGGFRFSGSPQASLPNTQTKPQILAAFPICRTEIEEMLWMLTEALNHQSQIKVILKDHPWQPIEPIIRQMGLHLNPQVFRYASKELDQHVAESMAMFSGGTSSLFAAIERGIPVIIPSYFHAVDLSPVFGVTASYWSVDTPQEFVRLMADITNGNYDKNILKQAKAFLDDYVVKQESPLDYARIIQNIINERLRK